MGLQGSQFGKRAVTEDKIKMVAPLSAWPWDNLGSFKAWIVPSPHYNFSFYSSFFHFPLLGFVSFLMSSCSLVQYMLYGPLVAQAFHSLVYEDGQRDLRCLLILILCGLRGLIYQLWSSFANMLFLTRNRRVLKQGVDFKQIDREWDW